MAVSLLSATGYSQTVINTASPQDAAALLLLLQSQNPNHVYSINGQTITVAPDALSTSTSGPEGTNIVMTPQNNAEVVARISAMLAANDVSKSNYYAASEIEARVGAIYIQDSGQAVAQLALEKYGLVKKYPNLGFGAALLEGNNGGKSGTAAFYGFTDYRKILGNVAASIGVGGGYDNWNRTAMGVIKADVEFRQGPHLGEYVGVGYAIENKSVGSRGLILGGGISYAF